MDRTKQEIQKKEYVFPYHYLDLIVDEYKLLWSIEYLSYIKIIKDLLKPFKHQIILDAGCGDGRLCFELKDDNVQMIGVDHSEEAIRFARAFCPKTEFYVQDLKNLDLPHEPDYIVLIETLEHIHPDDVGMVLNNLHKILKAGGTLIVTVPSVKLRLQEKHHQHFTTASLSNVLKDYFIISEIIGQSRSGCRKKIFATLLKIGLLLFPLRNKIKIGGFYKFINRFYLEQLERSEPEVAERLIAVCKKRKMNDINRRQ